ncbi:MAG: hypothetical protein Rubg2KO_17410 [Rubricoccaceae bacterium]
MRLALVLVLCLAGAAAAAQPWTFEAIDSRAGLPHNTVYALVQDARGFLWIGTADGLARYDGRQFEVYRRRPGQVGTLASNTVQALELAPDGTLWVGTSAGVCRLDDEATGQFTCIAPEVDVLHLLYTEGALWVAAFEKIWQLDTQTQTLQRVGAANARFGFGSGRGGFGQILESADRLVITTGDLGGRQYQRYRYASAQGRLVLDREVRLPPETIEFVAGGEPVVIPVDVFGRPDVFSPGWGTVGRISSTRESGGVLWFGIEYGLYRWTGEDLQAIPLGPSSALSNAVLAMIRDRSGALWVGTRNGLYVHDPAQARFGHLDPVGAGAATPVMSVASDADGALWAGTLGGGLVRVEPDGSRQLVALGAPDDLVWAVHPAPDGSLWLGTDAGLCRRAASRAVACRRRSVARSDGAAFMYAFEPDGAGGLWAGGSSLIHLDSRSGDSRRHIVLDTLESFSTLTVLHQDPRGRLWIGMEKRGLMRLDTPGGLVQRVEIDGLAAASVWDVHDAPDGALWLGTSDGLFHLDPETGRLTTHATALPGSTVYGVVEANGHLWLSTGRGLARYNPDSGALRTFGEDDGVRTVEFNRRAIHRSPDGRIHMGGMEGLTSFDPAAFDAAASPPGSVVTRVRVEGREGETVYPASPTLRLAPGARTVALELAAPVPAGAQAFQYAYRLDPIDDEWIEIGEDPVVRFAGLAPGHYTFEARASRGGGVWGEPATLSLILAPRWFQTLWFRVLAMLALVSLAGLAVQRRIHAIRREERMRWRIASDLHDDIGSGLSSVALLTERVRDRAPLADTEVRQLTSVASAARGMVESLREIVWFVDPAHERPGAFVARVRETAAALLGPRATVEAPERLRFDGAPLSTRRDVFLILKEALHNAARHAPSASVRIGVHEEGRQLVLTVRDDGPGFELATTPEGTGLRSLHQRAEGLGGTLDIASSPGAGTAVTLRVSH